MKSELWAPLTGHLRLGLSHRVPELTGRALLMKAGEAGGLTARGWTRTLRLARTIADLDGADGVLRRHVAEALMYRRSTVGAHEDFDRQASRRALFSVQEGGAGQTPFVWN
jgi:magnesium chelatase family protein